MSERTIGEPEFVVTARTQSVENLVKQCANGDIPFSGPHSLCQKMAAMGYSTYGLFELVRAAKARQK